MHACRNKLNEHFPPRTVSWESEQPVKHYQTFQQSFYGPFCFLFIRYRWLATPILSIGMVGMISNVLQGVRCLTAAALPTSFWSSTSESAFSQLAFR